MSPARNRRTPDGGYLLVGATYLHEDDHQDVLPVKTDAAGIGQWTDLLPGSTTVDEQGIAAVALDDGSYVMPGRRVLQDPSTGYSPVWLFKPAPNRVPVAYFEANPSPMRVGKGVTFDATRSYDPHEHVVTCEWDFGDGETGTGATVDHAYDAPGTYWVQFTAVDDVGRGDRMVRSLYVKGVQVDDPQFAIFELSVTATSVRGRVRLSRSNK